MRLNLIVKQGQQKGKVIVVKTFPAYFGRGDDCNFRMEEASISRKHFIIEDEDNLFYIRDFHSTNGTYVNGKEVTEKKRLRGLDVIEAGLCTFMVDLLDSDTKKLKAGKVKYMREEIQAIDDGTIIMESTKERLLHSQRALRTIYTVMNHCNKEPDHRMLLNRLLHSLFETIGANRGKVILKREQNERYISETCFKDEQSDGPMLQKDLERVIKSGIPAIFKRDLQPQPIDPWPPGVASMLCAPLISYKNVFGAVYLDRFDSDYRPFTAEDMELLAIIGMEVGSTLERAFLLEKVSTINQQLEHALDELRHTQQQVVQQERLRALGQMASGIAHDFNNVLTIIIGCVESLLLKEDEFSEDVRSYLEMTNKAAQDAARVVSNLREFYRYHDKEKMFLPCRFNSIIEQVVSLSQPRWKDQAQAKDIDIELICDLQEIPDIQGDESALRQMMINLVFNAVDAMPDGGKIVIRTFSDENKVTFQMQDSGIGMSDKVRERCLEPFFSTKKERGSGLGLSMVYGIVQRHLAQIEIKSEQGKGTTFSVHFPIVDQNTATDGQEILASEPKHILLVEDDPVVRKVIMGYLLHGKHTVEYTGDGEEGLHCFLSGKFDLVITDQAMPKMNGEQMSVSIKQVSPDVPIIMLTGFGDLMLAAGEKPLGVDLVLSKPVTYNALCNALTQVSERGS